MSKIIHIVQAYRWGDREKHSYVVGVYDTKKRAVIAADKEEEYRGMKYKCAIISTSLNKSHSIESVNDSFTIDWREVEILARRGEG